MSIPESWYDDPVKPDWTTRVKGPVYEAVPKLKAMRAARESAGETAAPPRQGGYAALKREVQALRRELDELRQQVQAQKAAAGG